METNNSFRSLLLSIAIMGILISLGCTLMFFLDFFESASTALSCLFPLALFYLIVFINESGLKPLPSTSSTKLLMWVFRVFTICILLLPYFVDSNFDFIGIPEASTRWWIGLFLGLFKVLGIEYFVTIIFRWLKSDA